MKVTTYKTVDVECECDVEIEDFVNELESRVNEADSQYWRRLLPAMDAITRIMARIPDEVIKSFPQEAREILAGRLTHEGARWDTVP